MMAGAPLVQASPAMGEEDFASWARLLERCTGIQWSGAQRSFLESRLRIRMREIGVGSFRRYYEFVLAEDPDHREWSLLLDRLTIHESRFYRHRPSFDLVRDRYLAVLDRSRSPMQVYAWSAGCATGEEPYTLAMVVDDVLRGSGRDYEFHVTGTDISRGALAVARSGVYSCSKLRDLPVAMRDRYFVSTGQTCRVVEALQQKVVFHQANILEGRPQFAQDLDLVMCQNLLIYFSTEVRLRILDLLVEALAPGGFLVLGPGEVLHWSRVDLQRVNAPNTLAFLKVGTSGHAGEGSHG
jgi:type IV pilus assembly protein PilK